jgi:hypothetical protein
MCLPPIFDGQWEGQWPIGKKLTHFMRGESREHLIHWMPVALEGRILCFIFLLFITKSNRVIEKVSKKISPQRQKWKKFVTIPILSTSLFTHKKQTIFVKREMFPFSIFLFLPSNFLFSGSILYCFGLSMF